MDLYAEKLDTQTGRYLYKGQPQQAALDRQTIAVKGQSAVVLDTWITRHGPVIVREKNRAYSLRWTAADGFGFPFMDINRAANFQQFRAALSTFWGPTQNFVYADKAGNIGYQAAGRVPVRRNFDGDFPLDGASGNFEWDGYIPFEQMPKFFNPAAGIIATANQRPFPDNYPYHITGTFADKYRIDQIHALLTAKPKLTVDDMLAIQKDVYSAYDRFLAKQLVAAYEKAPGQNPLAEDAVDILRRWDGQMDKDQAAPAITQFVSNVMGRQLTSMVSPSYPSLPRPQMIQDMLAKRPAGWVPHDNWDHWITSCLDAGLDAGRARLGSPVSKWRWGRILQWKFDHPVGKQLPLVDSLFDLGPVPMSGSGTTVKQTTLKLGPSERMVVDFGNLDNSVQNLVVGESGSVASGHYKDEWPAYYAGTSYPMEFNEVDARDTLRVKPLPR
jgi:penicillin amidase